MAEPLCLYFGCWAAPGHYLFMPDGQVCPEADAVCWYQYGRVRRHIDGTLAPRHPDSSEFPQGQFLRCVLSNGYTAIAWFDRCQGDMRGASNSVFLMQGYFSSEEMIAALEKTFPHVIENLKQAGIELVNVGQPHPDGMGPL